MKTFLIISALIIINCRNPVEPPEPYTVTITGVINLKEGYKYSPHARYRRPTMSFTNFALFEKNPLTYTASFPEWVTTGQLVLYVYYPYKDDSGETHKFYDTLSTSKDTIWDITPN